MAESATDKARRLAGVAQGALETKRLEKKGPVVRHTDPTTGETTERVLEEDLGKEPVTDGNTLPPTTDS